MNGKVEVLSMIVSSREFSRSFDLDPEPGTRR